MALFTSLRLRVSSAPLLFPTVAFGKVSLGSSNRVEGVGHFRPVSTPINAHGISPI